jgi:hypothetical protein
MTGFLTGGMRRAALLVTLAAGFGLVGVSIHGMTRVDSQLKLVDQQTAQPALDPHRDCHRHEHRGPDV